MIEKIDIKKLWQELFQSLIGKIKTDILGWLLCVLILFQSLIGKIKTKVKKIIYNDGMLFQSLIGKIKTGVCIRT